MYQRMLAPSVENPSQPKKSLSGWALTVHVATGFQTGAGVKQYAPLAPASGISRQKVSVTRQL